MKRRVLIFLAGFLLLSGLVLAQRRFGGGRGGFSRGEGGSSRDGMSTAREMGSNSTGTPVWENPRGHTKDVFTFARIRYSSGGGDGYFGRGGGWLTDAPDS
ncbi:MAG: transmembrane prediction, partial [Opitutaceae bacterium]